MRTILLAAALTLFVAGIAPGPVAAADADAMTEAVQPAGTTQEPLITDIIPIVIPIHPCVPFTNICL